MSHINLEEKIDEKKKFTMFEFENLSDRERISLFGEPTKFTRQIAKKIHPHSKENMGDDEIFGRKSNVNSLEAFSMEEPTQATFGQKIKKKLQSLVISSNNQYKSTWDFFLLIIVSYNCMIVCY